MPPTNSKLLRIWENVWRELLVSLIILLVSIVIVMCKTELGLNKLHHFLTTGGITIMGVFLSINCAIICNILIRLGEQEEKVNDAMVYINVKRSLKNQANFSLILFAAAILSVVCININVFGDYWLYVINTFLLFAFFIFIYFLWILLHIVFQIPSLVKKTAPPK